MEFMEIGVFLGNCEYAFKDWNQIRQKIEVGDGVMD